MADRGSFYGKHSKPPRLSPGRPKRNHRSDRKPRESDLLLVCPYCDFEIAFEEAVNDRFGRECHVECLPPTKKQKRKSKTEAKDKVEEFLQTEFPENPDH